MIGKIEANDVNFWYGDFHALKGISMSIEERSVVAFIGPSGCGKSTFLRLFNRMNDLIPNTRLTGEIHIDGKDIYGKDVQVDELRKKVGMVFQRPNPFPKSIFENVAYGLRVNGVTDNSFIRQRVEESLRGAALWEEVKDKLKVSAYALSGDVEQTTVAYIIRDHDRARFESRKKKIERFVSEINAEYGEGTATFELRDQYYNMREKIEPVMHIIDTAFAAMEAVGVKPNVKPIRGGTDGAQLSFKGLPCERYLRSRNSAL